MPRAPARKRPKKGPAPARRPPQKAAATRAANKRTVRMSSPLARDQLARLRAICRSLPATEEVEAWGHPTFRVGGKIFAGYGADAESGSLGVKTTHEMQASLVASDDRFKIAAYVGKHGWVDMTLAGRIDWNEVEALVRESYRLIAPAKLAAQVANPLG